MKKRIDPGAVKALALDLDGTALMPGNVLGERTLKATKSLMARGIEIIICTGRAIEAAEQYRLAMGACGPMVYFNGAEIADMPSGKILSSVLLDLEAASFGVDIARSMNIHYQVFLPAAEGKYETLLIDKPSPEAEMYFKHTGIKPAAGDLKKALAAPGLSGCIKAMFIADPALHDEIRTRLLERFNGGETGGPEGRSRIYVARTLPTFLEVMNAEVSKGTGLKTVMRLRGLKPEEVLACGDEENDLPMFDAAAYAAAPASAKEKVRAAADQVFPSNAEEGLADFLEELFKV
jgi:Cof subfamily protein (haloacid dehalogenase superfamily)